MEIVLTTYVE